MTQGSFSVGYAKEAAELCKLFVHLFTSARGETTPPSPRRWDFQQYSPISIQNTLPKREPPLTCLPGELSLTARCTSEVKKRENTNLPSLHDEMLEIAVLNLPESVPQPAWLLTISLVSLASFLPVSVSNYSSGVSAPIPSRSLLLLFPRCCQMTFSAYFWSLVSQPNSSVEQRAAQMLVFATVPPNRRQMTARCGL